MKIQDFVNKGINVVNSMGEKRITKDNSIVFPNGWVASIVKKENWNDLKSNYSVAVCDYNGYFNWDILNSFGAVDGKFSCYTENEVCDALVIIENLKSIR